MLVCTVVLELGACGRDKPEETVTPTRGLRADQEVAQPAAPAAAARPAQPLAIPTVAPPAAIPQAKPEAEAEAKPVEGPPPRDYGAELKALVGSPSGCLKPRPNVRAPSEISVTLEAVVMESGMISRAYARSGDLDDEELACVRARLQSARMQPGVEQAPRTVSSTISLVRQGGGTAAPAATGAAAAPPAAAQGAQPGYDQPEAQANYDAPEPPPDLDPPEAPSPSDVDQPETALPARGTPVNPGTPGYGQAQPAPAPEQPR